MTLDDLNPAEIEILQAVVQRLGPVPEDDLEATLLRIRAYVEARSV